MQAAETDDGLVANNAGSSPWTTSTILSPRARVRSRCVLLAAGVFLSDWFALHPSMLLSHGALDRQWT